MVNLINRFIIINKIFKILLMNNIKFYYLILDKLQEFIFILNDFNLKKLFNK